MKIVGYYNSFDRQDAINTINLKAITHLNYAFLLPASDGSVYFKDEYDVEKVVKLCHKNGIKAYVSVGGACDGDIKISNVFEDICKDQLAFNRFIYNVMQVVEKYEFDGIDLDWEYPWVEYKEQFYKLVLAFRERVDIVNIGLTIAIHRAIEGEVKYNRIESITNEVIDLVDWVNIMTYDDTNENNHSSFERATKSLEYWSNERRIPKVKLLIGVPFYARPSEKPYYKLLEESDKSAFNDFWGEDSYNGIYTVKEKTLLGQKYGGIIIWAINFDSDAENEYSLLNIIEHLTK